MDEKSIPTATPPRRRGDEPTELDAPTELGEPIDLALVALSAIVAPTGSYRQEHAVEAARRKEQDVSRLLT